MRITKPELLTPRRVTPIPAHLRHLKTGVRHAIRPRRPARPVLRLRKRAVGRGGEGRVRGEGVDGRGREGRYRVLARFEVGEADDCSMDGGGGDREGEEGEDAHLEEQDAKVRRGQPEGREGGRRGEST